MSEIRKLATILALDMVGYSRATEQDDSTAAEGVRKIRAVLTSVAEPLGGRIFNSAGDGFMLDFPTATAGLEAALALIESFKRLDPPLQVRIGLHTGEVIVEDGGDLLGHAVNIAARLQQRAKPSQIVLSEDVRRSARRPLTRDLVSLGDVKLEKMSETIDIFATNVEHPRLRAFRLGRRSRLVAIGAAFLALGALGATFVLRPLQDVRTAVFTLQAPAGDAALDTLARGVTTEIVDTLSQIGIETASQSETAESDRRSIMQRARSLGATFALDGELVGEGEMVRTSIRLNDVNGQRTLWAQSFERDRAQAPELRLEAASVAVAVMQCAVQARRDAPELSPSSLSTLLQSCELSLDPAKQEEALRLVEHVAQAAPRSSFVQGRLAITAWNLAYSGSEVDPGPLEQAAAAADAALRIDPANGPALVVKTDRLAYTTSPREWEEGLLSALSRAPDNAELNWYYALFLRTYGRPGEAVQYLRRAVARNPLSPGYLHNLAFTLASVGGDREALDLLTDANARWPDDSGVWYERFRINLWLGSRTEALRLLDNAPSAFSTADIQCYRRVAIGLAANTDAARRQVARAARECWDPDDRYVVLASIGDVDASFADVERLLADCPDANAAVSPPSSRALPRCLIDFSWRKMFYPMTASMRRDPRFMPLMRRGGLVDYWLETDRWPEYCGDPALPYNCRQEARRASDAAQRR